MKISEGFIKRNWGLIYSVVSLTADLILLNSAFVLSIYLRFSGLESFRDYTKPFVFINICLLVLSLGLGIYRSRYNLSPAELKKYYKRLIVYLAVSTMAFLYIIQGHVYSRPVIVITFFIFYVFTELGHSFIRAFQNRLTRKGKIGFNTIIIGTDNKANEFADKISDTFNGFYHIIGYLENKIDKRNDKGGIDKAAVLGTTDDILKIIEKQKPDLIFVVSCSMDVLKYKEFSAICESRGVKLKMVSPKVSGVLFNSRIRDVYGVALVMESWRAGFHRVNSRIKRIMDLGVLIAITPLVLPLGLFIALMVKLTSRGPVFFKQKRALEQDGKSFFFYKFRSMYEDAEKIKEQLQKDNESDGALFKIKDDPRVTRVGKFIRRTSLDELPQLINVLKGEMSFVGPRPLPIKDFSNIESKEIDYYWHKHRGNVKPGITGLWQVSGRSNLSFEEMLYLDLYYVEHQSIFFDFEILFETVPVVLLGKGAY